MKPTNIHRPWINFKELRSRLKFDDMLRHYKIEMRMKGDQHQGPCPLPGHSGSKVAPTFSANIARGIFQCFGCKAKGNALEFAVLMEKENLDDGDAIRRVALRLQDRFFPDGTSSRKKPVAVVEPVSQGMPVVVNEPLDFVLKDLAVDHPWFANFGLSPLTVAHFGLGFCSRGLLKNRIAIPLHDSAGRPIGYAGHVVDELLISDENPRYLFPSKREREGRVLDFQKSAFLYNGHRVKSLMSDLIVVSEIHSVWWLHQCGFQSVVALMGDSCSTEQVRLLVSLVAPTGHLHFMPDGGKEGEGLAKTLVPELATQRFVRWVRLDPGVEPFALAPEQLKKCLLV